MWKLQIQAFRANEGLENIPTFVEQMRGSKILFKNVRLWGSEGPWKYTFKIHISRAPDIL